MEKKEQITTTSLPQEVSNAFETEELDIINKIKDLIKENKASAEKCKASSEENELLKHSLQKVKSALEDILKSIA